MGHTYVNNGSWQSIKDIWKKDSGGTWQRCKNVYVNDNGTWRNVHNGLFLVNSTGYASGSATPGNTATTGGVTALTNPSGWGSLTYIWEAVTNNGSPVGAYVGATNPYGISTSFFTTSAVSYSWTDTWKCTVSDALGGRTPAIEMTVTVDFDFSY